MAKIELTLPAMGEGIIEATITKWLVSEGSLVEEDQPLVEIATDKVDSEIPSPAKGVVSKILSNEGEIYSVGDILAVIDTEADTGTPGMDEVQKEVERITSTAASDGKQPATGHNDENGVSEQIQEMPRQTPSGKFLTPLVRNIARKENVSAGELDKIEGSGENGRITRVDILRYLESPASGKPHAEGAAKYGEKDNSTEEKQEPEKDGPSEGKVRGGVTPEADQTAPEITSNDIIAEEGDRVIEMDRMRKLIASRMVSSKQTSPHATVFIDTDVTKLVRWRESRRKDFMERENQNLTFTPLFIEAAAKALRDFPMINVSVAGTKIIVKKNINIGMAVALADGNLIVPVIKNAGEKNLPGLARAVNELAGRARSGKLQPHEISGGTFTLTNFGAFKNTTGTPIINQPEVAILGTGVIIKKPVVLETGQGDVIAIRHIMTLSLSFDHRVVDGALGGMFLQRISEYLENFDSGRKI